MSGWLLEKMEIEGFRGVNNAGDPLVLLFKVNAVNSIFASNGVAKTSIFDALTYALTKGIPKLDELEQAEKAAEYYNNLFHPTKTATIKLTFVEEQLPGAKPGQRVAITVTRDKSGKRSVSGPAGTDAEAFLKALNREFVLLDYETLQSFMSQKAKDRGRDFSGLLGLAKYSTQRQELQSLANANGFNPHFDVSSLAAQENAEAKTLAHHQAGYRKQFQEMTGVEPDAQTSELDLKEQARKALEQVAVLEPHCKGKVFDALVFEDMEAALQSEEVGPNRERLSLVLRQKASWAELKEDGLTDVDYHALKTLAANREVALQATSGDLLHAVYHASIELLKSGTWADDSICPVCDSKPGGSIKDKVEQKISLYTAVQAATVAIAAEWEAKQWGNLKDIEAKAAEQQEARLSQQAEGQLRTTSLTEKQVDDLWAWRTTLRGRVDFKVAELTAEQAELEAKLPPSLVQMTKLVGSARQLRDHWAGKNASATAIVAIASKKARIQRIKNFLDAASAQFATAESNASARRLKDIEPVTKNIFQEIMKVASAPQLAKKAGGEDLALRVDDFHGVKEVSAQSVLSESYRNAFAVSVYLAAATKYGGAPRFIVIDDISSSFDAGHQYWLMELIRTKLARPVVANGPQVIFLSHDTTLEKLFNKNAGSVAWHHQRLEGEPTSAVLTQSNQGSAVRDRAEAHLKKGQVSLAAPLIRPYLEFKLLEIIEKVRIPVPVDFAMSDATKMADNCIRAIDTAIAVHEQANWIVMTPDQIKNRSTHITTILSNFLSHYATGSTPNFTAPMLLGVLKAIDDYAECFMTTDKVTGKLVYYKSLKK